MYTATKTHKSPTSTFFKSTEYFVFTSRSGWIYIVVELLFDVVARVIGYAGHY